MLKPLLSYISAQRSRRFRLYEKWIRYNNRKTINTMVETWRQSQRCLKIILPTQKLSVTVCWSSRGVNLHKFLRSDTIKTANRYCEETWTLMVKLAYKQPRLANQSSPLLQTRKKFLVPCLYITLTLPLTISPAIKVIINKKKSKFPQKSL